MTPVEDSDWIQDVVQRQRTREDGLSKVLAVRTGNSIGMLLDKYV
jgi:hypothetical protein